MINEKLKEILRDCSHEEMTQVGTGLIHQRLVDYELFAKLIVGQTVLQILATDHRHAQFTTYDKDVIEGATQRIVDAVKTYWNFQ